MVSPRRFSPTMSNTISIKTPLCLGAALAVLGLTNGAQASGFATARFGADRGTPVTDEPTAAYYNPAGIAASEGINILVDGALAYRLASYEHQGSAEPPDGVGANNGEGTLTNFVAAPMIGASVDIPVSDSVDLAFGAAFFIPFGGQATWDKNETFANHPAYPGPYDGVQRWYTIDGVIRTMYLSIPIAVGIMDKVYLGASIGPAFSSIDSIRARNADGANDNIVTEGRTWLDVKSVNLHVGGGVLVAPLDDPKKLRIGLSYQAPPGISGMRLRGKLIKYLGGVRSGDDLEVDVYQNLADVFRLGVSFRPLEELELRLSGDYHRWSLFQDQCITPRDAPCEVAEDGGTNPEVLNQGANLPRRWNDAGGVRVGVSYWVTPPIELSAGVGYDSNAIPDRTLDTSFLDFHDVSATVGARFQIIDEFAAAISYTHFFYISRDTTDANDNVTSFVDPSASPDNRGKYSQVIGLFNIGLHASFDPFTPKKAAPAEAPVERRERPVEVAPDEPVEEVEKPVEEPPPPPVEPTEPVEPVTPPTDPEGAPPPP
jgi:long-chain fatty acid transport protein